MSVCCSYRNLHVLAGPTSQSQTKRVHRLSSRLNYVVHHMQLLSQRVCKELICMSHHRHWGSLFDKSFQVVWLLSEPGYLLPLHNRTLHKNLLQKQRFHLQNWGKLCDSRHKRFLLFGAIQGLLFALEFLVAVYHHDQAILCCTVGSAIPNCRHLHFNLKQHSGVRRSRSQLPQYLIMSW